jgi:hypothetical protein
MPRCARCSSAKRVELRFGRHLHESPERFIREIETHEVCADLGLARDLFFCSCARENKMMMRARIAPPRARRLLFFLLFTS